MKEKIKIVNFGFRDDLFFVGYNTGALCWFDKDDLILMFLDWCTYKDIDHKDLISNYFDEFVNECNEHFLLVSVIYN